MKTATYSPRFEDEAIEYITGKISEFRPNVGIILGTGLGGLVKDVSIKYKIDYRQIPHFPVPTVESHHGYLIFGEISGKRVVIMQGRFHYYEGYTHEEVTFPVRVMKRLGLSYLIISNACGGMNPIYKRADLMLMHDHINFHFDSPLKNFALKSYNKTIYDRELISLAEKIAIENGISIRKGVYFSLHGPSLETRTEYRMLRKFGADVVGMSTIPEALLAANLGIKTLGISIITDMALPDTLKPAMIAEILEAAAEAEPNLTLLTEKIIERLN